MKKRSSPISDGNRKTWNVNRKVFEQIKQLIEYKIPYKQISGITHFSEQTIWQIKSKASWAEYETWKKNLKIKYPKQTKTASEKIEKKEVFEQLPLPTESVKKEFARQYWYLL